MELTLNIGYDRLFLLVKQLPANQNEKHKAALDNKYVLSKLIIECNELQILVKGFGNL
jgi:hypothetical protein